MNKTKKLGKKKTKDNLVNTSIYVTGLPKDISPEEMKDFFGRGGVIKIDPTTLTPKIKLYKDEVTREFSGNALVVYKFEQSIELALKYLNETEIRPGFKVKIEKAVFTKSSKPNIAPLSQAEIDKKRKQLKAAEMEEERLLSWSNEQHSLNSNIASRIVVLRPMYSRKEAETYPEGDKFYNELEMEVQDEVTKHCDVVSVTCIPRHPQGIVCVKLKSQHDAEIVIDIFNKRYFDGRQIEAFMYDGSTDFKASCI
ncbi:RNA recognition motif-containing protein [Cryptosporidium ubiquitum]|uniref:RNA recognition motif-containing protein n=1 Tax=Cryptosporidium ubiquitum TaxID=857276 RepID=A0A1J4MQI0_9CRYT|nr:RNA recognition motif-containing protein [Cryptosporidium ubiquitum]OII75260.1 RNA recognition motif-containing protein [Cryptosporidium ubiquitum]